MTPREHIEAITFAIGRLEAALASTPDEYKLPRLEIVIETLKARRAALQAELSQRMH